MTRTSRAMHCLTVALSLGAVSACASAQGGHAPKDCLAPPSLQKGSAPKVATNESIEIVRAEDVDWQALNPARGDKSPLAATLWGDRNGSAATGFLFHPVDGFESPPHIHNVSYRGIVIRGVVHNDSPHAQEMWMPPGSFWTQPKGHEHITSARGDDTLAYIEIDEGPYLVHPAEQAFEADERPVNVDGRNLAWVDGMDLNWVSTESSQPNQTPRVAFLWGEPQSDSPYGMLLSLPARSEVSLNGQLKAIVIEGGLVHHGQKKAATTLSPGSYFSAEGAASHQLSTPDGERVLLYVRASGPSSLQHRGAP